MSPSSRTIGFIYSSGTDGYNYTCDRASFLQTITYVGYIVGFPEDNRVLILLIHGHDFLIILPERTEVI